MDCIFPQNHVEEALGCVSLQWSSDDNLDHTSTPIPLKEAQEKRKVLTTAPAPWFGIVEASVVMGTVRVVRQNFPATPLVEPLHWIYHRFYVNRFYIDHSKEFVTFDELENEEN